MPDTPVVSQSPITLNVDGKHMMIPLSALYFDNSGTLKADRWPPYAANQGAVDALLARLQKQGSLKPGRQPAAKPAFTAVAITPGAGVLVEIEVSNVVPNKALPANSKADFKVKETDTYTAIEPGKLKDVIGIISGGGKRPGLVFVSSAGVPELPKNGSYAMAAANAGDPGLAKIPKNNGQPDAFTLQTRSNGPDAVLTAIEIRDADVPSGKFTLIATWTKTSAAQLMSGLTGALGYALTVTPPDGGFLAPAEGKVTLSGGSDAIAIDAAKASATVQAQ